MDGTVRYATQIRSKVFFPLFSFSSSSPRSDIADARLQWASNVNGSNPAIGQASRYTTMESGTVRRGKMRKQPADVEMDNYVIIQR